MRSAAPDGLPRSKRSYRHFCPAARALETIAEQWSLLIVRDLLAGPRRFSDRRRSLAAITPKWLSPRLRALESDGVVTREVAGEREVWYRLTPQGQALEPVSDASLRIRFDGARWTRQRGEAAANIIVLASPDERVNFLSRDVEGRRRWLRTGRAKGTRQRLDELATAFEAVRAGGAPVRTGGPPPEPGLRERESPLHRDRRPCLSGGHS